MSARTCQLALADLATRINAEHAAAEQHARTAVEHAIAAGALLAQAKVRVEHGAWLPWLAENFTGSARTASAYMRLSANRQRVADMTSVRAALEHLVERDHDDEVQDDGDLTTRENKQTRTDPEAEDQHPAQEVVDQHPAGPRQDKAIGRTRAIDPRRVVENIVNDLSGTMLTLSMFDINLSSINASKAELDYWTAELTTGIAGLRKLNVELNRLAAAAALQERGQ